MNTPPGLLCAACDDALYPTLARRTPDGFTHADTCRPRTFRECIVCGDIGRRTGDRCQTCADGSPRILHARPVRRGLVWRWEAAS